MAARGQQLRRKELESYGTLLAWNPPRRPRRPPVEEGWYEHDIPTQKTVPSPRSGQSGAAGAAARGRPGVAPKPVDKLACWRPETSQVVAAVESLYADKLKPFGRILLKRVRERAAEIATEALRQRGDASARVDVEAVPLIEPRVLRKICEGCFELQVEAEDGKEYSVTLAGRDNVFVDVCSPKDPYPAELWTEAAAYFEGLQGEEMLLPGGRYACAQVLMNRALPFLSNRSLGEICHIVQLAVSQKRILGYWDGNMVPFGKSVDCIKEQCAAWQQPVSFKKASAVDLPLATWDQARECLWDILESAAQRGMPGIVTLSNVKRLFRSRFGLELSETALGHSRLNELLQDVRLGDICRLELQGKSQVVVQRAGPLDAVMGGACAAGYWPMPWAASSFLEDPSRGASEGLDPNAPPWVPPASLLATVEPSVACFSTAPTTARSGREAAVPEEECFEPFGSAGLLLTDCVRRLLELDGDQGQHALQALSSFPIQASGADPLSVNDGAAAADETFFSSQLPVRGSQKHHKGNKIPRAGAAPGHREALSASLSTSDEGASGHASEDDSDGETESKSAKSVQGKERGATQSRSPPTARELVSQPPPGLESPPGL